MVQIIQVASDSPADEAGMAMGDRIQKLKVESEELKVVEVENVDQVQNFIEENRGREIVLLLSRGSKNFEANVIPRVNPPEGEGAIGIAMSEVGFISYPWYVALWKGMESAYLMLITMVVMFAGIIKTLIVGQPLPADVAGPVGIAVVSYRVTQLGFVYILQFAAIISLNLVILNIFPFPALDGGRLLFLLIEKIKRSPVNQKLEGRIHQIGFAILILFMIFITFRDVVKFF
jgi:regulator of sigma E protease